MKPKEREEARKLRSEGLSVAEIAIKIKVSKGSVCRWVRDIILTEEQKKKLNEKGHFLHGENIREEALNIRKKYQQDGRNFVKSGQADIGYYIFCSLYWAEGSKSKGTVGMTSTDADMLNIFVSGLRKYFNCNDEKISVRVMCHLNNGLTIDQINDYWIKNLNLPRSCIRKFILKTKYFSDQNKKHKRHVYGGCTVRLNSTEIVQKIHGSIQEIFKINRDEWLWD